MPASPSPASSEAPRDGTKLARIAGGQRLVIYAILLNLVVFALTVAIGDIAALLYLPVLALSLVGLHRLASGLGYAVWKEVCLMVLMLIPLLNIITLVVINSRATKTLRAGGYTVGLLGASRID